MTARRAAQGLMPARIGYLLIVVGLALALLASALDRWTDLGRLELVSACAGLVTSLAAAIVSISDVT